MKQPSSAELIQMLQAFEGGSDLANAASPQDLLDRLRATEADDIVLGSDSERDGLEIVPEPGFVVKTTEKGGGKVFINMCGSDKIPAPSDWTDGQVPEHVKEALKREGKEGASENLRFPISVSDARAEQDHQGVPCTTYDCAFHTYVLAAARMHRSLKRFLIELALGYLAEKYGVELDSHYKLPKMRYKGDKPHRHFIRREAKPLITELSDALEEPSFPLLAAKSVTKAKADPSEGASFPLHGAGQSGAPCPDSSSQASLQRGAPDTDVEHMADGKAGTSRPLQPETHVEFLGRPVNAVQVLLRASSPNTGFDVDDSLHVDIVNEQLKLTLPGCAPVAVQLPFAVSLDPADGAEACLASDKQACSVRLPFRGCRSCFQQVGLPYPCDIAAFCQYAEICNGIYRSSECHESNLQVLIKRVCWGQAKQAAAMPAAMAEAVS